MSYPYAFSRHFFPRLQAAPTKCDLINSFDRQLVLTTLLNL